MDDIHFNLRFNNNNNDDVPDTDNNFVCTCVHSQKM